MLNILKILTHVYSLFAFKYYEKLNSTEDTFALIHASFYSRSMAMTE